MSVSECQSMFSAQVVFRQVACGDGLFFLAVGIVGIGCGKVPAIAPLGIVFGMDQLVAQCDKHLEGIVLK
jgi:hypothetical protein